MATLRYSFRPSLFSAERTLVLEQDGITVHTRDGLDRRVSWPAIEAVHIEPATTADEKHRLVVHLKTRNEAPIDIDSVNVRGAADFERKTEEFLAVLDAIHRALAPRKAEVTFRYGARRGVLVAW
jgi:hypothetical protein